MTDDDDRMIHRVLETVLRDPDGAIAPDVASHHYPETVPEGTMPEMIAAAIVADLEDELGAVTADDFEGLEEDLEALGLLPVGDIDDGFDGPIDLEDKLAILERRWQQKYGEEIVFPPESPRRARDSWQRVLFRKSTEDGWRLGRGTGWRCWAIAETEHDRCRVTHMPSGFSAGEFSSRMMARRYCEGIDALTDWRAVNPANLEPDVRCGVSDVRRRLEELKGE